MTRLSTAHVSLRRIGTLLCIVFLLSIIIVSVWPFIYMFLISLTSGSNTLKLTWDKLAKGISLDNYKRIFSGGHSFARYTLNSAILSAYSSILACLVSSMAAYAFAKKRLIGGNRLYLLYLATMMIPSQVVLIPTFLLIYKMDLLNTYTGLTLPTVGAYGTILIYSFMKNIPDDLLSAADIDGCGELRKFFTVVLPLLKPALIALIIYQFIGVWGSLIWPLVATTDVEMSTVTLAVSRMKNEMIAADYGYIMAGSTLSFLPPFILYLLLQRQFVEGIALSGTKG